MKDIKWDLNDIVIIPAEGTDVNSRSECNVFTEFNLDKFLPIMAAPMDTVVSVENYKEFLNNDILPCIPRGINPFNVPIDKRYYFQSFGLCEIERRLNYELEPPDGDLNSNLEFTFDKYPNVLIDIANGHMNKLIPIVKEIKKRWPDMNLMVGNVANPETFANLGLAGADFVRCSIGTGAGCTTAANVGINYPIGSLIQECRKIKTELALHTKIVADGGMRNYSDVIKSLALGADYVMIGSIFNKAIESAGFNYLFGIKISQSTAETLWSYGFPVKKKYRGMSTKAVQRSWGKTKLVTAEGITKYQKIEYNLSQWVENFQDYLRSNMSYCGARNLEEFIGETEYVFITELARKRFEK